MNIKHYQTNRLTKHISSTKILIIQNLLLYFSQLISQETIKSSDPEVQIKLYISDTT